MPADPATINRANTIMSTGNYAAKLALLRELPVCPPSNYQHGGAHAFAPTLKSPLGVLDNRATKYLTKKKLTTVSDRVAFIKFKARADASGEPGSIEFELKYAEDLPSDASRVGYIPIWFLPWESGFMWKLKIESSVASPTLNIGAGTTAIANPDVFFTAAINGCSVFARGAAADPSLYHGGAEQNEIATIRNQVGNAFWQQIGGNAEGLWLNLFHGFDMAAGPLPPGGDPMTLMGQKHNPAKAADNSVGEVNKNDYVKQSVHGADILSPLSMGKANPADRDKPSTIQAVQLENYLTSRPDFSHLRVEEVSPWGCVFGLRNGNNWEFYLQTNATVRYYTIHRKKRFARSTKTSYKGFGDQEYATLGQPMQWPKGQSVNMGTKQFFPGGHGHVAVDPRTFRFF